MAEEVEYEYRSTGLWKLFQGVTQIHRNEERLRTDKTFAMTEVVYVLCFV